jgi:hypothetical protein
VTPWKVPSISLICFLSCDLGVSAKHAHNKLLRRSSDWIPGLGEGGSDFEVGSGFAVDFSESLTTKKQGHEEWAPLLVV